MITGRNRIYEDPKVSTNYSILIAEDTGDTYGDIYKDAGLFYAHKDGTTSQSGYAMIVLGNNKASGTDKNKAGMLRVTDDASVYWWNIKGNPNSPLAGYRDIFLPPNSGTLATKPVVLYNNTAGTVGTVTLSQDPHNFTKIKIYWRWGTSESAYRGCYELQMGERFSNCYTTIYHCSLAIYNSVTS